MIQTECGIFSVISKTKILSNSVITNLQLLQHRGRESFGVSWFDSSLNHFRDIKYMGIITQEHLHPFSDSSNNNIYSKNWLGHVRYSTSATIQQLHLSQPILSTCARFSLAHNGNIPTSIWPKITKKYNYIHTNDDTTDSYILSNFIEFLLNKNIRPEEGHHNIATYLPDVIKSIIQDIHGVYSLVITTKDFTYVCRDRFGVRPITYAIGNDAVYISSESNALQHIALTHYDVAPGEIISIHNNTLQVESIYKYHNANYKFCIFEFIYFMRDESAVNSLYVHNFKNYIGLILAKQYITGGHPTPIRSKNREGGSLPTDAVVCGVPQSGILYAKSFAKYINAQYVQFLQRNSDYPWRTFILKTNKQRLDACKQKYCITENIEGKSVILVDDSIVRGNTLKHLISLVKSYNPKQIHFVVASPPIKYTCSYGVDFADIEELVANKMSVKEMELHFGFNSLTYLDIDNIKNIPFVGDTPIPPGAGDTSLLSGAGDTSLLSGAGNTPMPPGDGECPGLATPSDGRPGFCNACFTGNYLF